MQIERTYKSTSRRSGQVEIVDESVARLVFGQTKVAFHDSKAGYTCCKCPIAEACTCGRRGCYYCAIPAMEKLLSGKVVETFFSRWQLLDADGTAPF